MTVGVQTFCGARLSEARRARGLFIKTLADMIGVTRHTISRYEEGFDKPQQENLDALARQLKFPVEFFLRPAWPEVLDLIFWRSRTSETKSAREMTVQRMRWLCEIFNFLEEEVNFPNFDVPKMEFPEDFRLITSEMIERGARLIREHWGLRDLPIPDMTLALENAGIPVINLEVLSDKQDGFSFRSAQLNRTFVGINIYNMSAARARYDAAHELGHIALHKNVTPQQSRDPAAHKIMEQQAHRFAGAILFPKEGFLAEVPVASLDYFSALKKRWGISIAAMILRASDLGLIDEWEKISLYQNLTRRRWRGPLREPFDSHVEMPLERPRMLRRGVDTVLRSGIFGRSAIRSALPFPQQEIERIVGVEEGFLNEAEVVPLATPKRISALQAIDLESGKVLEFPHRKSGRKSPLRRS
jgi:Zn-dependent peptidase ImmA (M78 family)/transcriptional regulator with XRE-family HTH domain